MPPKKNMRRVEYLDIANICKHELSKNEEIIIILFIESVYLIILYKN